MLLSLTPNPAIDRILIVPGFRSAEVCRIAEIHDAAGAKGLNVVRVARTLGIPVRACGPLAGETGRRIAALASEEGIDARWVWLPEGESRVCLLVIDPAAPDTLVLNEHGPRVAAADWAVLAALVRSEAAQSAAVASSGSLPLGVDVDQFIALLADLAAGGLVFLDTSGPALAAALDLPLALLKVNAHELGDALGASITTPDQARAAAALVHLRGPRAVIVTLGKDGAVAVGDGGAWWARAPEVALISPVGSGDALLAGVAAALLSEQHLADALALGVACGAANTLTIGAGVVRPNDVTRLRDTTTVVRL
jgi:1-phosphofructokinase family hexose kinase